MHWQLVIGSVAEGNSQVQWGGKWSIELEAIEKRFLYGESEEGKQKQWLFSCYGPPDV